MIDPFKPIPRNATCWCGSGLKHKNCHGKDIRSAPGAPVPKDLADGSVFLSPTVTANRDAFRIGDGGTPIYLPSSEPEQRPIIVPDIAAILGKAQARTPSLPLAELAVARFEALRSLGLTNIDNLSARIPFLSGDDRESLRHAVLDTAKSIVDRLIEQAAAEVPPTVVWAEGDQVQRIVGQTMLWADHYLVPDDLCGVLFGETWAQNSLENALTEQLALRELMEAGIVVPVPRDVATVLVQDLVQDTTEHDVKNEKLVQWVMEQLIIEGPTAREVLFLRATDGDRSDEMLYLYCRIDRSSLNTSSGTVSSRLLGDYDPNHDYVPWIEQCRRQTAARFIQDANLNVAIGEVFGGRFLTSSPFRARLLKERGSSHQTVEAAVWAEIPYLPEVNARQLAQIVQEDGAVEALRQKVRRVFSRLDGSDSAAQMQGVEGLGEELAEAARVLELQIRNERRWSHLVPGALQLGSIWLAPTGGLAGVATLVAKSVLVGLAGVAPYRTAALNRRKNPAFALMLASSMADNVAAKRGRGQATAGEPARRTRRPKAGA